MKMAKVLNILGIILFVAQVIAEAFAAVFIHRLNMLPGRFFAVVIGVLLGALVLTGLLMFVHGKKPVSNARKTVAGILALLIALGCGVAVKLGWGAYQAMNQVTTPVVSTDPRDMYVFVRTEDPAQTLADTKDYRFAVLQDYEPECAAQMVEKIEAEAGGAITAYGYETSALMADALFGDQADALILNGVTTALLMEEEGYEDFLDKARILYSMSVTEIPQTEPPETTAPVEAEKNITNTPFVLYISGSDTRYNHLAISRSDVNILAVINPETKQILLINTPRDYFVANPRGNGALDKLTHCGIYGPECSMGALEGLYGLEIDDYCQINFKGFEKMVDAVGGITVYSNQAFHAGPVTIQKGENTLNGEQALAFSRDRYHVSGGDNGRGKNQMKVIKAVVEKVTSSTVLISQYAQILDSLGGMFKTSLTMDDISALVKMQLDDMASWNIQSFAVTGLGGSEKTYSAPSVYAYVMHPNLDTVSYAKGLADRVLAGEVLSEADLTMPK